MYLLACQQFDDSCQYLFELSSRFILSSFQFAEHSQSYIIYLEKRRMNSLIETNKYITRLVKIIYNKEKIIEELKNQNRKKSTSSKENQQSTQISILSQKIKQDVSFNTQEVKLIHEKIIFLELRINELTEGLNEEINLNAHCQEAIRSLRQNQVLLNEKLQTQLEKAMKKDEIIQQLQKRLQDVIIQKDELAKQCESAKIQKQYQVIIQSKLQSLAKSLLEQQKYFKSLAESINNIYNQCLQNTSQNENQKQIFSSKQHLQYKLKQVERFIKDKNQVTIDPNILNDTLEDISIIMKSFEEKFDEVVCMTERQRLSENINRHVSSKETQACDSAKTKDSKNILRQTIEWKKIAEDIQM